MLNFFDFIQVYVFTTNHHLNDYDTFKILQKYYFSVLFGFNNFQIDKM